MNWVREKLGNILEIQNGYAFDSKLFNSQEGLPLIRIRDLKDGFNTETRFSGVFDEKYLVKKGDYLIGMDGEFGCYEWLGGDALLNQRVCRLNNSGSTLSPRFLFYGINSYLKNIEENTTFTTVKHLSSRQIASIEFPIPPLSIQQKIVEKLDTVFAEIDKAIVATEANIKNAEDVFDELLNEKLEQFSIFPKLKMGDICDLYQGLAINKKTRHLLVNRSSLPLLRIKDLKQGIEEQHVSETGFPPNALVEPNEIIYTRTGSLGLVFRGRRGVLQNNSFKVKPRDGVCADFLFWWLQSSVFKQKILGLAMKAAQPDISHKIFKEQDIYLPPMNLQSEFSYTIEKAKEVCERLRFTYDLKLENINALKNSILHDAFNVELVKE